MSEMTMEKMPGGPEPMQTRLMKKRKVLAFGKIDEKSAEQIIALLLLLESENPEDKITLYIDSEGGNETDILAIYDAMRMLSCPVETLCVGKANGLSALLLAGGKKGMRLASENSEIMLAQVSRDRTFGQASDIELESEHLLRKKKRITALLAELSGNEVEKVTEDMERKCWMFADEALAYGLIDRIV